MWDDRALEHLATDLIQARDATVLTTRPSLREAHFDLERGYQVGLRFTNASRGGDIG